MTIALITGTRPEIIKMFPIIKYFDSKSIKYTYIHTGQHYAHDLFIKFLEEFRIRKPDYNITMSKKDPIHQVSTIFKHVGSILNKVAPSMILVEGDTNSVLASALAALKVKTPIAHIEAGLRSNDWRTVEEHNRRIVDHFSDMLFSPTVDSSNNLRNEHVYGQVFTVGNTVIDAIDLCLGNKFVSNKQYKTRKPHNLLPLKGINFEDDGDFILVTMHRSENVDNPRNLKSILLALSTSNLKFVFPMHPHTLRKIKEYNLTKYLTKDIKITAPMGYIDFLNLLRMCRFVVTDSGGVQEEVTSPKINKRALILRDCTERPESVESGHCNLCKIDVKQIIAQIHDLSNENAKKGRVRKSPYGDGTAAPKIGRIIERRLQRQT